MCSKRRIVVDEYDLFRRAIPLLLGTYTPLLELELDRRGI